LVVKWVSLYGMDSYLTSVSLHELGCVMIFDQALQTVNALHLSCKGRKEKICARISSGRSIPLPIEPSQPPVKIRKQKGYLIS